jgi:thiamine pyrophosphokinase
MSRIVIFANGEIPNLEKVRALMRADDFILCADGGTHHALALGLMPQLVIGDMDSVAAEEFQRIKESGAAIELFPRDKNETDLELALQTASKKNPDEILVIGALGGRLDQTLGNLALLSNAQLSSVDAKLDDGLEEIFFCREQVQVEGRSGEIVSLIPWQGKVEGIETENLKWPLRDETLYPEKTRGISNEMSAGVARVKIKSGVLLVVHRRS